MRTRDNTMEQLRSHLDAARFHWHEVTKVQHYWPEVGAMTQPLKTREDAPLHGER